MTAEPYEIPRSFGDYTERPPDEETIEQFRSIVYEYYGDHRRAMPWRETTDPYRILVSEVMLQQTQVPRVLPKYEAFLSRWPDVASLAAATLRDVLSLWQGLGYNRRGRALHEAARILVAEHDGHLPDRLESLKTLPGVGDATAAAILSFGYGVPALYLETNVRRVFIHFFFNGRESVRDREIVPIATAALDTSDPRNWHYALMDYGVMLRARVGNPNRRSAHYARQGTFEGSDRQIRGRIIAHLVSVGEASAASLVESLPFDRARIEYCVDRLESEGMIAERHGRYTLPS